MKKSLANSTNNSLLIWAVLPLILTLLIWPAYKPLPYFSIFDGKRIMQLISVASILIILILLPVARKRWLLSFNELKPYTRITLIVLLVLAITSCLQANSIRHALLELALFSGLFISAFYLVALIKHHSEMGKQIILFTAITAVLLSFIHFVNNGLSILTSSQTADFKMLFNGFANPRFFNQWQGVVLPLLLAIPMIKPDLRKHEHALIWLLVSYLWAGILLSGGRGIVLSLLISTLLTAWWLRAFRYEWLRRSLIGFLGGLAFYGLINLSLFLISGSFLTDNNGISRLIENTGSSGRIDIWLSALQQAISHPFFGLGGMHFSWFSETGFAVAHPHNIVLQLLVEWGIPFTLILVTVAGLALLKWMKRLKQQQCDTPNQWFYFAISNAFITGNLHSLVSGTWVMPISQLSLTVVTAFMLAHYQTEKTINSKIKTSSQYLLTTFSIIILALLIYGITPELKDFNNWLLSSLEEVGSTRFAPRFWVQGLIPQPI